MVGSRSVLPANDDPCKCGTYAVGLSQHQQAVCAAGDPTAFPKMKTILTTDWAPHIERNVRAIVPVLVAVYAAGYATGAWLHRLNDRLARRATPAPPRRHPGTGPVIIQPQAAATAPANIAPPVLVHISDPMARAVRMVRIDGKSQRLAASLCGVSRSSLQRALKVAA